MWIGNGHDFTHGNAKFRLQRIRRPGSHRLHAKRTHPLTNNLLRLYVAGLLFFVSAVLPLRPVCGEPLLTFETHIRPIFKAYCFDCHGAEEELQGGLDLRLRRLLIKGGKSGPAIEPGNSEESLLLQRIQQGEMPPRDVKLNEKQIATIAQWIATEAPTAREEPQELDKGIGITPEDRSFWSFQPVIRPVLPESSFGPTVRTPIDALLMVKLQENNLSFSPDAERFQRLRRASLDLRGLPITLDELAKFSADDSPNAYEKVLDRLLASHHYGERWGRHWLDVAGYADSEGITTADPVRNFSYKYRDYVIRSLNCDKPLNQFIVEQLAGDELVELPYEDLAPAAIEKLVATGFLRMAGDATGSNVPDLPAARNQVIEDTLKIVSSTLLGLTVGCAQCHDHRHDPILQTDYYSMRAIFAPAYNWTNWRTPGNRLVSLYTEADRTKAAELNTAANKVAAEKGKKQTEYVAAALDKELEKFDASLRDSYRVAYYTPGDKRTEEQKEIFVKNPVLRLHAGNLYQYDNQAAEDLKKYDQRMAEIRSHIPFHDYLRVLTEVPGEIPTTHLFHRGNSEQPREAVAPGGLTVTAQAGQRFTIPETDPLLPTSGRRLAYARWLTSGKHPLVGRVLVNRMWMHHLGRGLVATPADFGAMGVEPTHPQVLDWLASELVQQQWSLKQIHRTIMTSTVYRQASRQDPALAAVDPDNRFLWRKPIQRLEAEIIRDRILATSGQLNQKMFGPPVSVDKDKFSQIIVQEGVEGLRRSVYVQVRRTMPVSLLQQFDMPVIKVNCEQRASSTVATQSLTLMNSDFILEQAAAFGKRLLFEAGTDPRDQIVLAWQSAFTRPPTEVELERSLQFLTTQVEYLRSLATPAAEPNKAEKTKTKENETAQPIEPALQALMNLCQTLMSSNEFLYVD